MAAAAAMVVHAKTSGKYECVNTTLAAVVVAEEEGEEEDEGELA